MSIVGFIGSYLVLCIDFLFKILTPFELSFWLPFWLSFGAFVAPGGVSGTPLGVIWGSLGSLFGVFGGLLAAVGCLRGPLGLPGSSWDVLGASRGRFPEFRRVFRVAFWTCFRIISIVMSCFFSGIGFL